MHGHPQKFLYIGKSNKAPSPLLHEEKIKKTQGEKCRHNYYFPGESATLAPPPPAVAHAH